MDVQKDWDQVINKPDEKFWILQKRTEGQPTVHGYLQAPNKTDRKLKGDNFAIRKWNEAEKHLEVECTVTNTIATFIAPQMTLSLSETSPSSPPTPPTHPLLCMNISPSGELGVASSINGNLWIWDTENGETKRILAGHIGDVDTCQFFPSGLCVLSGGSDFRVKIWSVPDGKCPRTLTGHTRGITDLCMIDKGRNVISTSYDGTTRLWECGSGQCIRVLASTSAPINGCDLIVDSALVSPSKATPSELEYGTEGKLLLTVSDDNSLRLYDIRNSSKVGEYVYDHSSLLRGVFMTNDRIVVGGEDGNVILLDIRNIKMPITVYSLIKSSVTSLHNYNENTCIVGYKNGACAIWNLNDSTLFSRLTGPDIDPVTSIVTSSHVTSDHAIYTSCRDGNVRMYKL